MRKVLNKKLLAKLVSNKLLVVCVVLTLSIIVSIYYGINKQIVHSVDPITWTGTTSTDWATASNWSTGVVPVESDFVVINGGTNQPTLDLTNNSVTIANLSVGQSISSTLTILGGAPTTNVFNITGNLDIGGYGTITHSVNISAQVNRLAITINGDASIQSGGKIDVSGKGYSNGGGPGNTGTSTAAAYGGDSNGGSAYGNINLPIDIGSGGRGGKGGDGGDSSACLKTTLWTSGGYSNTSIGGKGGNGTSGYTYCEGSRYQNGFVSGSIGVTGCGVNGVIGQYDGNYHTYAGSSGGSGGCGGDGGGAVHLIINGTLNLDGSILANGNNGGSGGNGVSYKY